MASDVLECALDLMRRLPPAAVQANLAAVVQLAPEHSEDLLETVDQPLKVATCPVTQRPYLLCDYNRDADSYRSPWSNQYDPALPDGNVPSDRLRQFEIQANEVFAAYTEMYYSNGLSSVYCWDLDSGFAACILIKKTARSDDDQPLGTWDSIHVVEVCRNEGPGKSQYKLTSTVTISTQSANSGVGKLNVGGSLSRQAEKEAAASDFASHLTNIGEFIQDQENRIRGEIDHLYFGKTKEVVAKLRSRQPMRDVKATAALQSDLASALARRRG